MSIHKKEYDTLLTDEKRRRERNIRLLAKLENIEKKATFLQAKTDRIKSLKSIYQNKFDKNGVPISYTFRDDRLKYHEGYIPTPDVKIKNNYYDKYFDLQGPYDMKPKVINSCYITKNITLEEAIEEISRRFVLIPKTPENIINREDDKLNTTSKNDIEVVIKTQPEIQSNVIHIQEPEKVVSQNKVDFKLDKIEKNENEIEVEESHRKEFDSIENKEEDLSEIEYQNMQIQNEEEKYENNIATSEVSQEIPDTKEHQLENRNDSINSKLKHLSSEIAHVDQMGIENNSNDNNTISQEEIVTDYNMEHSENFILNEKIVNELQQEDSRENETEITQNTNDEAVLENLNQNSNEMGEYFKNQYEQGNNEYIEQNIDQQQPMEQYENNNANYTDETPVDQFNNETSNYNSQITEENVAQEQPEYTQEQYYENPNNYDTTNNYDQTEDQNQYNTEDVSQYEGTYDQNEVNNDDNYAYDNNTEQVTNEYDESNVQEEYQNYTEQNNVESEQYNNYEQQDSQYYDDTTIEDSPIKDVQPDIDGSTANVKPLQILDSDTDPVSVKEETSVQESDFDFSTQ